jgi:hypothetical protein
MKITKSGFDVARGVVIGALPQSAHVSQVSVRERRIAPTYVPMTGAVRPQPTVLMVDSTDHPFAQGNVKGGVRVRTWSPPD